MRLINVNTRQLVTFSDEAKLPRYAILSHRWIEGEEVLYKDLLKQRNKHLAGWNKIEFCCKQAIKDGVRYAWIDTCCIDKNSSAELSEAINSMYRWYAYSEICYVLMTDVDSTADGDGIRIPWKDQFLASSWFTRSWTLQELLAPRSLRFFDKHGKLLDSRQKLCDMVSTASGIHWKALVYDLKLSDWSVAQRMSWASTRTATRVEDIAYSLLGLFDVNMPLLYGEGTKAFRRLQEEIIRQSSDHTIFAWSTQKLASSCQVPPSKATYSGVEGLLAPNPSYFERARDVRVRIFQPPSPFAMTNLGLSIELPTELYLPRCYWAGLNCSTDIVHQLGIWLIQDPDNPSLFNRFTLTLPYTSNTEEDLHTEGNITSVSWDIMPRDPAALMCQNKAIYLSLTTRPHQLGLPFFLESLPAIRVGMLRVGVQFESSQNPLDTKNWFVSTTNECSGAVAMKRNEYSRRGNHFPRYSPVYGLFLCVSSAARPPIGIIHILDYQFLDQSRIAAIKLGFDREYRPFAIVQTKRSGHDGAVTEEIGSQDHHRPAEIADTVNNLHSRSFWECTGLETDGWLTPSNEVIQHPKEMEAGLWGLKCNDTESCVFILQTRGHEGSNLLIRVRFGRTEISTHHYKFDTIEAEIAKDNVMLKQKDVERGLSKTTTAETSSEGGTHPMQSFGINAIGNVFDRSADTDWSSWLNQNYTQPVVSTFVGRQ